MKTVCISFAVGCPRSSSDATRYVDYFVANGWEITTRFQKADLVLVGTCGVTAEVERSSMQFLSMAKKRKPEKAQLIVFGCLAGINKNKLINELGAIPITKTELHRLDSLINADINLQQIKHPNNLYDYSKYIKRSFSWLDGARARINDNLVRGIRLYSKGLQYIRNRESLCPTYSPELCYIRIATGCNNNCTYCGIKNAVGPLLSRTENDILKEYRDGLYRGYKKFRLIADDVGAYGQDIGITIVTLLSNLLSLDSDTELRIDDFSPKWLLRYSSELLDIFIKYSKKISHISLPVQSGSEKILNLMERDYTAEDVKKYILQLRQEDSNLDLRTHIIVGFPGETEQDFCDTLNFLKTARFKLVTLYKYSERPNTPASRFPHQVSETVKVQRVWKTIRSLPPGQAIFVS